MKVYLDNAASTPVAKEVLEAMLPYFSEKYGNASSIHEWGREAKEALEAARETIKKSLNAKDYKVIFTSGGTESNNFAIKGIAFADKEKGKQIISSTIEHGCIHRACRWLEKQGWERGCLEVDKQGFVNLDELRDIITKDTILVSIIHGNNEIGTIQDLKAIGDICKEKGVPFHTDACQSFTKMPIDLQELNVDLMTINSHKIHGPKGVGALLVKEGVDIKSMMHGGGHEYLLRSGTENISGIVGFAKAVEIAKQEDIEHMKALRDMLTKGALEIEDSWLNGPEDGSKRLCNNANFSFKGVEGEALVLHLDAKGIAASTGSACTSKSLTPSHTLTAIGLKPEESHSSIRFGTSKYNTKEEIEYTLENLKEAVKKLREISPVWKKDV